MRARVLHGRAWRCACFGTEDADLEHVQSVSNGGGGTGCTGSRGGGQKRLIQVVDYVTASATLHSPWAGSTRKGGARPGNLASRVEATAGVPKTAVLVFELPSAWTWECLDAKPEGGGDGATRGRWADRSAAPVVGEETLEHILGPAALWLGEYKVDRQAGEKLSQILSGLNTSLAQMLTAFDGEQLALMMQRNQARPGALSAQGVPCTVPYASLSQEANAASATEANKFLAVHIVADCIELHSGLEQTDEGVVFHLNYRLKLPLQHASEDLPGECLAELDVSRWHPLWTCNLSASALATSPDSDAQARELRVICQRYRGKPNDVGICMFGLGSDENGVETLERRMLIRRSMDGFGASFSGLLPGAAKNPLAFNMFLCKSGAGNQAAVQAPVPRVVLPNSCGLGVARSASLDCGADPQRPCDDDDEHPHLNAKHGSADNIFSDEEEELDQWPLSDAQLWMWLPEPSEQTDAVE